MVREQRGWDALKEHVGDNREVELAKNIDTTEERRHNEERSATVDAGHV